MRLPERVASCQLLVASKAAARDSLSVSPRPRVPASPSRMHRRVPASPRPRVAFTLVEMLVVMGIIVIAIAMAVPTIKYLTGSKSEQAAQNAVAAMLARTRSDAIALQQPQGVLFTIDLASDRVTLYQVVQTTLATDPAGITYLDLTPDRDPLLLPPGVRAWTIKDPYVPAGIGATDPFPGYRYLGFNDNTSNAKSIYNATATDKALIGGVILFDGQGNLLITPYGFRFLNGGVATALSGALFLGVSQTPQVLPTTTLWPSGGGGTAYYLRSQAGLVLFDRDAFQTQERQLNASVPTTGLDSNPNGTSAETALDTWLDQNTTPLLVNRYNGTLTRAE
jgi:type II secretory pathway pseudopilin PulG